MIALKFSFDVKNIARSPRSALRKFWQILATAVIRDIHVNQMYVKASFLNGDLSEDIFMDQPEGYQDDSDRVCKLKKSFYGLKQKLTDPGTRKSTSFLLSWVLAVAYLNAQFTV